MCDHLPSPNHLAGFGADGGDGSSGIGPYFRVTQLLLRDTELRFSRVDLSGGGLEALECLVELSASREPIGQELLLSPEGVLGLAKLTLRGREACLRLT
jgi:hypothetical protein